MARYKLERVCVRKERYVRLIKKKMKKKKKKKLAVCNWLAIIVLRLGPND